MECYQPSSSFKIRGIGLLCKQLAQGGTRGFLSSSGGNAGLAVAYAGHRLGIATTIVVPTSTSAHVRERMRDLRASVIVRGEVWDESDIFARQYAQDQGLDYIHPFDDPVIWRGHASLIEEMKQQGPKPDVILCSVGGGGLLCGVMEGLYQNDWSDVDVLAVETVGAASLYAAVQAGEPVSIDAIRSIAKSLGARRVADKAWEWTQRHPIHCLRVSDEEALRACVEIADDLRILVEPACGAAYAALSSSLPLVETAQSVAVILCGGSGVHSDLLGQWKQELRKEV